MDTHQRWAGWLRRWRGQHAHGVATAVRREALADRMRQASQSIFRGVDARRGLYAAGEAIIAPCTDYKSYFGGHTTSRPSSSLAITVASDRCGMTRMTVPHEMHHGLTTFIVFLQCDKTRRDCVHELIVLAPSATMCNRIVNAARAIEGMPRRP